MNRPPDLISSSKARELLGISPTKMSALLRENIIPHWVNPLDKREKLVSRSDVLALLAWKDKAA